MSRTRKIKPAHIAAGALINSVFLTGILVASPFLLWRFLRIKRWRTGFSSRLGLKLPPSEACGGIWIHTVSAGELLTAAPLVNSLRKELPGMPIVLSVTTEAGHLLASERLKDIPHFFWPLDFSLCVKKVLKHVNPKLVVLVELELWPNFLITTEQLGIKKIVVNGRITERCERRWSRIKPLAKWIFNMIDHFAVQNEEFSGRLKALGVAEDKISICGNLKFDVPIKENTPAAPLRSRLSMEKEQLVIVAGCTHPGEEEMILKLLPKLNNPGLVLAPRHLERVPEVLKAVQTAGYSPCTFKSGDSGQVMVVDQFGVLDSLYKAADIVVMGGTFVQHGGHNFLEPARWGKPIVFGKSIDNFRDIAVGLLAQNGAIQVQTEDQLEHILREMLKSTEQRKILGDNALTMWKQGKGAVQQYTYLIKNMI